MKKNLIVFLLFFCNLVQGQDLKWFKTFSEDTDNPLGYNYTQSTVDITGNLIIGGRDEFIGCYLNKIDSSGTILWKKKLSTATELKNIVIDNENNVIITGTYIGNLALDDSFVLSNHNIDPNYYGEVYIIKYSADGKLQWAISSQKPKELQGIYPSHPVSYFIETDCMGNIYASGVFSWMWNFGNFKVISPDNSYNRDAIPVPYLLKISPDGEILTTGIYSTSRVPLGLFSSKDNIYNIIKDPQRNTSILYKYDLNNKKVFEKEFDFNYFDFPFKTNDALYFVSPSKDAQNLSGEWGISYCENRINKYNFLSDTITDVLKFSGLQFTIADITPDFNGNLYIIGGNYNEYENFGNLKIETTEIHKDSSFILKYNEEERAIKWIKYYKDIRFAYQTISILNTKSVIVTGCFGGYGGSVLFNGTLLTIPYGNHLFILGKHNISDSLNLNQYNRIFPDCKENTGSLGITEKVSDLIDVFPNPCENYININGVKKINRIDITDILGTPQHLNNINIQEDNCRIDMSGLKSGFYIVIISTYNGILTKKVYKVSN